MQFSLILSIFTAFIGTLAVEVKDLRYNSRLPKRQTACQPAGALVCNSQTTFSICAPSTNGTNVLVFFGDTANGTVCEQPGQIRAANYGPCSPDGELVCGSTGETFFICDHYGLIKFGPVAPGTYCSNGKIMAA
ncbi:hypothetical protein MMC28_003393 [Mycoblastus sanguinarius]|nr:hypothetical protein [Mycoblastus sanguinarius]